MLRGGTKEMANPTQSAYYVVSLVPHLGRDHPGFDAGPWDPRLRAHGLEACAVQDANTGRQSNQRDDDPRLNRPACPSLWFCAWSETRTRLKR